MAIDRELGVPDGWGITREMMMKPRSRIPFIEPENIPDELGDVLTPIYSRCIEKWGTVPRYYQMLAHSPAFIEAWQLIEERVRRHYLNTDPEFLKVLQLVIVKTAILNHSNYCTGHNTALSRSVGITWEQLDAIEGAAWADADCLSARQKAAVRWADAVTKGKARHDDDAFRELQRHFTTRQVVEVTFFCGMWNLSARLTEPFHQTCEVPEHRIVFKDEPAVATKT